MDDLRIDLASFQGPLDLLLYLVQREEVDIYDVPLARIADHFLEACREQVDKLDVDRAGAFLVMASHLLVLKSRALLPRDEPVDLEDIDPRLELVKELLAYREFKARSSELAERAEIEALKSGVRVQAGLPQAAPEEEELEVDLFALVKAFQRLLAETGEDESVAMAKERLPITHFVGQIFDQLTTVGGRASFRELVGAKPNRSFIIGAFLALLELIKLRKVRVEQDGVGEMFVELRPEALILAEEGADAAAHAIDAPEVEDEEHEGPRIVFMGTPAFAVPSLRRLVAAGLTPVLVVTPPPMRTGRGRRLKPTAVAEAAREFQIPLHRTNNVNLEASLRELRAAEPDVIVTAAFGQKLRKAVLSMPSHGCLNVHASLLPAYRGASPIAAAIRDGAKEIGVTIFRMTKGWDEGPVLDLRGTALADDATLDEATAVLSEIGGDLLVDVLPKYLEGSLVPEPQDGAAATYVGRIEKQDGVIAWDKPARDVHNHVRSVTTWPGAQTAWQPRVKHEPTPLLVTSTVVLAVEDAPAVPEDTRPGTVLATSKAGIDISCAEGVLRVLRVRPQGKREMAARDFLNARPVRAGDRFARPRAKVS